MKSALKRWIFRLLAKRERAVVVAFLSGDPKLAEAMLDEVRLLIPDRELHVAQVPDGLGAFRIALLLRHQWKGLRIGMAAVLFTSDGSFSPLRRAAFLLAPRKILAYNARLERHHLTVGSWIASLLFLRGVPLDRIWLRPSWLVPWKKDRSVFPETVTVLEGRALSPARPRVAVVSPYFPYPLSHGGAVRIYNLLRQASEHFDIFLFSFHEPSQRSETASVLEFCARAVLFEMPRYREPRWSTIRPPEVCEFDSPVLRRTLEQMRREFDIRLAQVEYTYMASCPGSVLVEHDVTFDLYRQALERAPGLNARWSYWRWLRYERAAVRRYGHIVTMSAKDQGLLSVPHSTVIPNGVDLDRFASVPESPGNRLLFIGSFRHFPNIVAYRFFREQVWPLLRAASPDLEWTVVAGPDWQLHWRATQRDLPEPPDDPRIHLRGFVRDVRPLYHQANLVVVPTLESAGTNLKVLEALAMERAVVSTSSGCAGLGLEHHRTVWIADQPGDFASGVLRLLSDAAERTAIAQAGRAVAVESFSWTGIGGRQTDLWRRELDRGAS